MSDWHVLNSVKAQQIFAKDEFVGRDKKCGGDLHPLFCGQVPRSDRCERGELVGEQVDGLFPHSD